MSSPAANSPLKPLALSLFFGIVACGTCFYLITFLALIAELFRGPLNPANTPGFAGALKHVVLPLSIALGALTFLVSFARLRKRRAAHS